MIVPHVRYWRKDALPLAIYLIKSHFQEIHYHFPVLWYNLQTKTPDGLFWWLTLIALWSIKIFQQTLEALWSTFISVSPLRVTFGKLEVHQQWIVSPALPLHKKSLGRLPPHNVAYVAYMVYLPDVWLQFSWCIISLRWWSFRAQLEMPDSAGDTSWVWIHAYKTCSEYRIYKNTYVPVLRIQASSNQYISTGYESGYHYDLKILTISFTIFKRASRTLNLINVPTPI